MPIIVQCPSCERKLRVPDDLLGKKVKCPGCKVIFTGKAESPAPPPPPPASRERQRPEAPLPPTPPPPESRERQRPEARPGPPPPPPPLPTSPEPPRPEPPAPAPPPSTSGGMAALENLGLEEDEPAPPPPPAKNPSAPAKHPASPGIAALDNLDMELEDEPAPPPKPSAEKKTAPEPMKPLAPISKGVAIFVECPACERKLRVPEELLGKKVKCPGCGGTFVGEDKTRTPAPKPPVSAGNLDLEPEDRTAPPPRGNKPDKLQLELDDKPRPPPTAPSDIEEMEEISSEPMKPRPVRAKPIKARDDGKEPCPYCGELIKQGATRCKHCGEDLDEEDDDRPSRRGKSKRSIRRSSRDAVPHRASMVMTLGIISVSLLAVDFFSTCCCGVLGAMLTSGVGLGLGIPAWIMGQKDLAKMRDGLMDPSGRGSTQTGWICGMIGTILHGLGLIGSIILLIFVIIIQGASLMSTGTGFGRTPSNTPGRKFEVPRGVPRLEEDPPERIIPVPAPAAP